MDDRKNGQKLSFSLLPIRHFYIFSSSKHSTEISDEFINFKYDTLFSFVALSQIELFTYHFFYAFCKYALQIK